MASLKVELIRNENGDIVFDLKKAKVKMITINGNSTTTEESAVSLSEAEAAKSQLQSKIEAEIKRHEDELSMLKDFKLSWSAVVAEIEKAQAG